MSLPASPVKSASFDGTIGCVIDVWKNLCGSDRRGSVIGRKLTFEIFTDSSYRPMDYHPFTGNSNLAAKSSRPIRRGVTSPIMCSLDFNPEMPQKQGGP